MSDASDSRSYSGRARELPFSIVFNATSGSGDVAQRHQAIGDVLRAAGRKHTFFPVRHARQLQAVARRAVDWALRESGAVVVAGGDGTINTVVQLVLGTGLPFGIIPQGTFNYSGRAHYLPLDGAEATRVLLRGHCEPLQVGLVNGRAFLVNASLGLYPRLLQEREAYKRQLGRYRAVAWLSAFSTVLRNNGRLTLELEHGGRTERVRTPSLFVGNNALQLKQAGLPEAQAIGAQRLVGVVVQTSGVWGLVSLMVRGAMSGLGAGDEVRSFDFERLTVRPAIRGVLRLKVALDGEMFWMRPPVVFTVAPEPLQLLSAGGAPVVLQG